MRAAIISTGDELVGGQLVDSNAAWLSVELNACGVTVGEHVSLGDDKESLARTLSRLAGEYEIICATGGLGPTADDLTRFAVAELLAVDLELNQTALTAIEKIFERINRPMPATNRLQAMIPAGCGVLANCCGTAPGIFADYNGCKMFFMPGVPSEMKKMFANEVLPILSAIDGFGSGNVIRCRTLHTLGLGESMLGERIADLMARGRNPSVNTNAGFAVVKLRIRATASDIATADAMIADCESELRERLGDYIWGVEDETLAELVVRALAKKGQTLTTVESCTGGLIAKNITDVPGASSVYSGGWCVYSNQIKQNLLEVSPRLLAEYGAVSEQVAGELARNGRRIAGSDYAISTTGIAGPGGGSELKPVGLVYIALAGPDDSVEVVMSNFSGMRDVIRQRTTNQALALLLQKLK